MILLEETMLSKLEVRHWRRCQRDDGKTPGNYLSHVKIFMMVRNFVGLLHLEKKILPKFRASTRNWGLWDDEEPPEVTILSSKPSRWSKH